MAWEENSRICINMQLIAILSRIEVIFDALQWQKHSLDSAFVIAGLFVFVRPFSARVVSVSLTFNT